LYSTTPPLGHNRYMSTDDAHSDSARPGRSRRTRKKRVIYTEGSDSDTDSPYSDSNGNISDDTSESRNFKTPLGPATTSPIPASLVQQHAFASGASNSNSQPNPNGGVNVNGGKKGSEKKTKASNEPALGRPADMRNVLSLCTALQVHPCQISQAKKIIIDECFNRKILKSGNDGAYTSAGTKTKDTILVDMNKTGNVIDFHVRVASSCQ